MTPYHKIENTEIKRAGSTYFPPLIYQDHAVADGPEERPDVAAISASAQADEVKPCP